MPDFNSHAPCGARLMRLEQQLLRRKISTHTPLAGRDWRRSLKTHAHMTFQLTRPLRGATKMNSEYIAIAYISTHTPLAGRDLTVAGVIAICVISTHTPLAGRDGAFRVHYLQDVRISTHTPLAGRDCGYASERIELMNFNSHAPCGARRSLLAQWRTQASFQLTRPLRGATKRRLIAFGGEFISTHTPLAGRDPIICAKGSRQHKMRKIYYPISRKIPVFTLFL